MLKLCQTSPSPRLHSALLLLFITSIVLAFPLLPFILPRLSSTNSTFLLPLLLIVTLLLSLSTANLQSAVIALASLWGSPQVLAVMSGQGGIAVLVSGTQVTLAIISALNATGINEGVENGSQSTLAGVGLWSLAAIGALGCMLAHRYLMLHPDYSLVLAPAYARRDHMVDDSDASKEFEMSVTRRVLRQNWMLESAVAWVFIVTLVGRAVSNQL